LLNNYLKKIFLNKQIFSYKMNENDDYNDIEVINEINTNSVSDKNKNLNQQLMKYQQHMMIIF